MYCGVVGLMIPGLQPLLLGALAEEGRLRASQLGDLLRPSVLRSLSCLLALLVLVFLPLLLSVAAS